MTSKIWFVISNGSEMGIYDDWSDVCLFGLSSVPGLRLWTCASKEAARAILAEEQRLHPLEIDDEDSSDATIVMSSEREQSPPPDADDAPLVVPHKRPRIEDFAFEPAAGAEAPPCSSDASTSTRAPVEPSPRSLCSAEQEQILKLIEAGYSVFFTGAAGTGKSYLIGCAIEALKQKHSRTGSVLVTATTGAAAINIGGTTIHSASGIMIGELEPVPLANRSMRNPKARATILACRSLIIDEISMMSAELFDKLEFVFRYVRCGGRDAHLQQSWGGVQVILSGDFLQLPPVQRDEEPTFAFDSKAWRTSITKLCVLKTPHRQSNRLFVSALEELRHGVCSPSTRAMLETRVRAKVDDPVILYAHTADVARENARGLAALGDVETHQYKAVDYYNRTMSEAQTKRAKEHWPVDELIVLKLGARVMLLRNIALAAGLCNGSQGTIVSFHRDSEDGVEYPVVSFRNGITRTIRTEEWSTKDGEQILTSRKQVPLTLAYALTIHKSQGCTLDAAQCSIGNTFAPGQAYVAVSRTRTLEGLSLSSVPATFKVSESAVAFHKRIGD